MASPAPHSTRSHHSCLKLLLETNPVWFLPCDCCACLNQTCICVDNSSKCCSCVKASNIPCIKMVNPSGKNWDCLLNAHEKLVLEEDSITNEILKLQHCMQEKMLWL